MTDQHSNGRVILASIAAFTCAAHDLDGAPALGTLVVAVDAPVPIYGVVADVRTESIDPGRQPAPRGGPGDDRAAVLAQNPQLPALLHTLFEARVVGHGRPGALHRYLPDAPAPIYGRVRACDLDETAAFFEAFDFFPLLLAAPLADDILAASLRQAAAVQPERRAFLVRAGRALAQEMATEPERLLAILGRVRA